MHAMASLIQTAHLILSLIDLDGVIVMTERLSKAIPSVTENWLMETFSIGG
jgi:hypothetical protein